MTKDTLGKIFLFFWIIIVSTIISFQMAGHLLTMPVPKDLERLDKQLNLLTGSEKFTGLHILFDKCSCTNSLIKSLLKHPSSKEINESILWVGTKESLGVRAEKFLEFGYRIIYTDTASLKQNFGVEVAPILALKEGKIFRYLGGYYDRPGSTLSHEKAIIKAVLAQQTPKSLPVYGCAVSDDLQNIIDPLSILY